MRRRSDQSARARSDRPYQLWHPLSDLTSLYSSFFFLSLSLSSSALLAAINPLSSACCNDAAIGGTLSRAVPILVNLWMSTEVKSYRYLPRVFTNGRRYAKVLQLRSCARTMIEGTSVGVHARTRVALSGQVRALLEARGCVLARTFL